MKVVCGYLREVRSTLEKKVVEGPLCTKWLREEIWLKFEFGGIILTFSKWEIHEIDTSIYRVRCLQNGVNPKMVTCTKTTHELPCIKQLYEKPLL